VQLNHPHNYLLKDGLVIVEIIFFGTIFIIGLKKIQKHSLEVGSDKLLYRSQFYFQPHFFEAWNFFYKNFKVGMNKFMTHLFIFQNKYSKKESRK